MGPPSRSPGQPLLCPLGAEWSSLLVHCPHLQSSPSAGEPRPCLIVSCGPKTNDPPAFPFPSFPPSPVFPLHSCQHPPPSLSLPSVPLESGILPPAQSASHPMHLFTHHLLPLMARAHQHLSLPPTPEGRPPTVFASSPPAQTLLSSVPWLLSLPHSS